jgi:hypothetical protein
VNFQVNNPDDLANMLFPGNTNVNMTHVHEGLLSHADAIHELAKSIHGNRTTDSKMQQILHSKIEDTNAFNHEVFGNHTTALQMMQATHAEVDSGLRNHQKHIEETLKGLSTQSDMFGENIRRMQSLKVETECEHEIHKKALGNRTMVLNINVADDKSSPPPRVGRLHLHRCRPTRLRLMGALSLTRRKPRGRSGLHSTPGLASTVLTRRLAPAWGIFARTVPGVVPRCCTPGFHRSPLLGFDHL